MFPEVRVAISSSEKPVVPRASSVPSSSTSSSSASSTSSVAKTHSEVDKDMQMLQKFYNGVTAALDRLTKAVEKQTIEPKRIACHLKRPRSKSLVRYQSHGDKRYRQFIMVFLCRSYVHENIEQLKEGVM